MPGITGYIAKLHSTIPPDTASTMVGTMLHERYYRSGTLSGLPLGIEAGWATHPGSYADCLPIWNEDHSICLLFSGDEYTDRKDISQLRTSGHTISDTANASRLVHLYEELGDRFFERLNGTFAGLLVDLRQQKAFLFNDRYGLGRIYYHEGPEGFYFSTEAKSILRVLPRLRQIDVRGIAEYLACGCVLQNRTLFQGIAILPPGSLWTFAADRRVKKSSYFRAAEWEAQDALSAEDYYHELKRTFTGILPKYFEDSPETVLSVTGGLDSRMVVAAAANDFPSLKCYSVRGMYRKCADAKLGRRVAHACGLHHSVITVDRGFFSEFPDLARRTVYNTDGTMDAVGTAGMYANRLARGLGRIRMTGNYGGEVLRGVSAFRTDSRLKWLLSGDLATDFDDAGETFATEHNVPRTSFILFKQVPWHHYARFAMESSQLVIRSPFLDNELVKLAFRAPKDAETNRLLALRLISDCHPIVGALPTDRGTTHRPAWVSLRFWNWWKEFFPRVEYAFDYGMPDWLARIETPVSFLHLDRLVLGVQKYCHFRTWYRHELAPYVRDFLLGLGSLSQPYLNRDLVLRNVSMHLAGKSNCTVAIHKLITFELIHRTLLAAPSGTMSQMTIPKFTTLGERNSGP